MVSSSIHLPHQGEVLFSCFIWRFDWNFVLLQAEMRRQGGVGTVVGICADDAAECYAHTPASS